MRLRVAALAVLVSASAAAAPLTVARLPACSKRYTGVHAFVRDGNANNDCGSGGGSYVVGCWCNGTTWAAFTVGGTPGADGADGLNLLSGSGAPSDSNGVNGEFYIDLTGKKMHGPKAAGAWPSGVSIVGATGAAGSNGSNGSNGTNGTDEGTIDNYGYDPDKAPSSGLDANSSDEFAGSISGIWSWGNQGTATDTYSAGGAVLMAPKNATNQMRCRWATAPSAVDFTVTAKIANLGGRTDTSSTSDPAAYMGTGPCVMIGTAASPTKIYCVYAYSDGSELVFRYMNVTSYLYGTFTETDTIGTNYQYQTKTSYGLQRPNWYQLRYIASTKVLTACFAQNGIDFTCFGNTATLASHPAFVGRFADPSGNTYDAYARFFYFRTRTDASRNLSGQ